MALEKLKLETMRIRVEDKIAVVVMDHPPVNTVDEKLVSDMEKAYTAIEETEGLRCVVISSALPKVFVAGADINQFLHWSKAEAKAFSTYGHWVLQKIEHLPQPVICAIGGVAYGGGMELALACDIRVMDRGAKIGLPEVGLGMVPGHGGTQRLPRLIGSGQAKRLMFMAQPIGAQEALGLGLVEAISEKGQCLALAMDMARQISKQAPLAVTACKRCINYGLSHSTREGIDFEVKTVGELVGTEDLAEGARAFFEKREAHFKGK